MTTEDSGFLAAGGILPWHEGDELPEDIIRRYRGDCSNIEAERDAALAEIERLRAENTRLLEERAAVRKSLGEHFIAIADEDGNPTDSAYYMDQGVGMLATQWQFSQDQLEQAHQELDKLRAELTTTLVGCSRCERGVPPRYAVCGMCPTCAAEELTRLRGGVCKLRRAPEVEGDEHYICSCAGRCELREECPHAKPHERITDYHHVWGPCEYECHESPDAICMLVDGGDND